MDNGGRGQAKEPLQTLTIVDARVDRNSKQAKVSPPQLCLGET